MGSCLREQQRSRRGVELRKVRFESALVASGSSGALPSTYKVSSAACARCGAGAAELSPQSGVGKPACRTAAAAGDCPASHLSNCSARGSSAKAETNTVKKGRKTKC